MPNTRSFFYVNQLEHASVMAEKGLRYQYKKAGSPFQDSANMSTMSCYRCGLHKSRALGSFIRLLNQRMFVCGDCGSNHTQSSKLKI